MLRNERKQIKAFQRRNFLRWKSAFDQIEMIWQSAQEIGGEFRAEFENEAAENQDYKFEAMTRLHGRGMLVAAEAIHLLKGGYPDGAMSRWRTLHEIFVVSVFLSRANKEISRRYLAHLEISRAKAATQVNYYSERANLEPFSDEEIREIEERKDAIFTEFGKKMKEPFGWACPAFKDKSERWNPNFMDLEEYVGLDHWRPRYKWASQHTHAGSRDLGALLGMSEATTPMILVGPSNSGFVDPLQMTALHISNLTVTLILTRENIDTLVMSKSLIQLAHEVAHLAILAESNTNSK